MESSRGEGRSPGKVGSQGHGTKIGQGGGRIIENSPPPCKLYHGPNDNERQGRKIKIGQGGEIILAYARENFPPGRFFPSWS